MIRFLDIVPWLIWLGMFVCLEAYGFRRGHDHWPTLSQVIKGWEDHQIAVIHGYGDTPSHTVVVVRRRGIRHWSWERWGVAIALPVLLFVLWPHLVTETF